MQYRSRFPLIASSLFLFLLAIWAGLVRLGWRLPPLLPTLPLAHGPLMVSGFLGTLIALERAVALRARWTYIGPLLTSLGGLFLALGIGGEIGKVLIVLGSLSLLLVFAVIVRRHFALYTVVMAVGALAWLVGNLFWLFGWPIYHIVLWWAGFLVLTIAGERLELGRLTRLSRPVEAAFLSAVALFLVGLLVTIPAYDFGSRLAGVGMIALGAWLLRYDLARHTVRKPGLPRYIAICLLAGYVWLLAAGLVGFVYGGTAAGPRYDALLHAIFLGFVISMIFGHAPIIFPAILGVQVTFHPVLYAHLILLHGSLLLRSSADLAGAVTFRLWGGLLNGIALLLFLGSMAFVVTSGRRTEDR